MPLSDDDDVPSSFGGEDDDVFAVGGEGDLPPVSPEGEGGLTPVIPEDGFDVFIFLSKFTLRIAEESVVPSRSSLGARLFRSFPNAKSCRGRKFSRSFAETSDITGFVI